jgi:hypothetical protein
MNAIRYQLIAAAILSALAAAVQADDITPDPYRDMASTLTRAEVVAARDAAPAAGELHVIHAEDSGSFHLAKAAVAGTLTRADVHAEVLVARRDGTLGALTGEDSGSFALARSVRAAPSTYAVLVARAR